MGNRAGGVLNCGHAAVQELVIDSLVHLSATFGFSGFCFLQAESLAFGMLSDAKILIRDLESTGACFIEAIDQRLTELRTQRWSTELGLDPSCGRFLCIRYCTVFAKKSLIDFPDAFPDNEGACVTAPDKLAIRMWGGLTGAGPETSTRTSPDETPSHTLYNAS